MSSATDRRYNTSLKGRYRKLTNRAKSRGIECLLTFDHYCDIVVDAICTYCDGSLPKSGHGLDRKDNKKGYTLINAIPSCWECNAIKGQNLTHREAMVAIRAIKAMRATRGR